jgi:menaquinone-dependent protoporphyrinogen IX oxidase
MSSNGVLIIYRSFLGATEQYAGWLSEELGCDRLIFKKVTDDVLDKYDSVVVMSGTYAGRMPLVGFLKKHWSELKDKHVFVAAVGAVLPESRASELSYLSIPDEIRKNIWYIKIPGRLAHNQRSGWTMKRDNIQRIVSAIRVDNRTSV